MKKINLWKILTFLFGIMVIFLLVTKFRFSKDFSNVFITSLLSKEFFSSIAGALFGGLIAIYISNSSEKRIVQKNLKKWRVENEIEKVRKIAQYIADTKLVIINMRDNLYFLEELHQSYFTDTKNKNKLLIFKPQLMNDEKIEIGNTYISLQKRIMNLHTDIAIYLSVLKGGEFKTDLEGILEKIGVYMNSSNTLQLHAIDNRIDVIQFNKESSEFEILSTELITDLQLFEANSITKEIDKKIISLQN
ncbi:hypothetical protein [Streptococcus parauberis]|uniref:hypothetical protein n=1 Tax=Streptococcus parauberis TaxID=1348 RepID=UPI0037A30566